MQIIYCTFLFSYISFYETDRNNVNPSLFIQLAKVKQQNELKNPGVSEYQL